MYILFSCLLDSLPSVPRHTLPSFFIGRPLAREISRPIENAARLSHLSIASTPLRARQLKYSHGLNFPTYVNNIIK